MAVNEAFHDGEDLYLPVIAGVVAGGPVIVGMIPGVAQTTRDAAGFATVRTKGAGAGVIRVRLAQYAVAVDTPA